MADTHVTPAYSIVAEAQRTMFGKRTGKLRALLTGRYGSTVAEAEGTSIADAIIEGANHVISITIRTDNAAFGETEYDAAAEVARILQSLAAQLTNKGFDLPITLRDYNGNTVGVAREEIV